MILSFSCTDVYVPFVSSFQFTVTVYSASVSESCRGATPYSGSRPRFLSTF